MNVVTIASWNNDILGAQERTIQEAAGFFFLFPPFATHHSSPLLSLCVGLFACQVPKARCGFISE